MKKFLIIGFLILLAAAAIWRLITNKAHIDSQKVVIQAGEVIVPVRVARSELMPIQMRIEKPARILPWEEALITVSQPALVVQVLFDAGDEVKAGQVLGECDKQQKELTRQSLELTLEKLRNDLIKAENLLKGGAMTEAAFLDLKFQKENTEIQLAQVLQQIKDSRIVAPITGIVTSRQLNKGDFANPGMPLGRISDLSKFRIYCSLSSEEVRYIKEKDPVIIRWGDTTEDSLKGVVRFISPCSDETQKFTVEILAINPNKKLRAGGFAKAVFEILGNEEVTTIPKEAFGGSVSRGQIFIVRDSVAIRKTIRTGRTWGDRVEVLAGLDPGNLVVVTGHHNLSDSVKVRIID